MLGFIAYPMISVFYYSLQNYNVTKPWRNGFAGLDNFTRIFTDDPLFWQSLGFSLKWVVAETGNTVTGARLYENSDDGIDLWMWASPVTAEHTWSLRASPTVRARPRRS